MTIKYTAYNAGKKLKKGKMMMYEKIITIPEINAWRQAVLDAFDPNTKYYYHTSEKIYDGFIDMLAWTGWTAASAHLVGDEEVKEKCIDAANTVLTVAKDARTFAPHQVRDEWKQSPYIEGLWYKEKPQSFAGPSAWLKLKQLGVEIKNPIGGPFNEKSVLRYAKMLASVAWPFGFLAKHFKYFRQHINSMWLAHEVLGRKVPSTMEWTLFENPFYCAINGVKFDRLELIPVNLPRWTDYERVIESTVQPLLKARSSDWIWRRDPFQREEIAPGATIRHYHTPSALLTAAYFQFGKGLLPID